MVDEQAEYRRFRRTWDPEGPDVPVCLTKKKYMVHEGDREYFYVAAFQVADPFSRVPSYTYGTGTFWSAPDNRLRAYQRMMQVINASRHNQGFGPLPLHATPIMISLEYNSTEVKKFGKTKRKWRLRK